MQGCAPFSNEREEEEVTQGEGKGVRVYNGRVKGG